MQNKSKEPFYPREDWERLQRCLRKVVSPTELRKLRESDWYRYIFRSTFPITEEEILRRPWEKWQ